MNKLKFIIPLAIVLTLVVPCISALAYETSKDNVGTILIVPYNYGADGYDVIAFLQDSVDIIQAPNMPAYWSVNGNFQGYPRPVTSFNSSWTIDSIIEFLNTQCTGFGYGGSGNISYNKTISSIVYVYRGSIGSSIDGVTPLTPTPPEPPEPEPSDSWLSDMWDWFLYALGFGDDPSIIQITGGDKVETEIVTPTPSPSPTPIPTPTPYSLNVIDPSTGQPVYTITGIPSNTYNIYGGETTNNGTGFDIFDVDLKIGNGGTSKPKDDLNEVMRTNNDYIQEMNVSAVKNSFSVLPSDWFLLLGVLASMPIIAGIISKMLK